jgi:phage baseplate assembly protein W
MNAATGRRIGGVEHLKQSIADILRTPKGSRVMLRDYGSNLFKLVDRPLTPATITEIYAETVDALGKWEPRLRVTSVSLALPSAGHIELSITAKYLPSGQTVKLDGIVV